MSEFKTSCGKCGKEIVTVNDPEGHKIYHGQCFADLKKPVGGKKV